MSNEKKEEIRYDAAKRVIRIGDTAAATVSNYSWMEVYKIVGFTPKMIRVTDGKEIILRTAAQLVRIEYTPEDLASVIKHG